MINKWKKNDKKMKKKLEENCNFQKKNTIFLEFFSFFFIFFHFFIIFHHFCFQWCKNFARNGKLQLSSSFFHFVYHFFIMFLSFLLPVVELMKNDKKWWKMIKKWKKKWKKTRGFLENCNFPRFFFMFFHFFFSFFFIFFIFFSFFIIFASSGGIDAKW